MVGVGGRGEVRGVVLPPPEGPTVIQTADVSGVVADGPPWVTGAAPTVRGVEPDVVDFFAVVVVTSFLADARLFDFFAVRVVPCALRVVEVWEDPFVVPGLALTCELPPEHAADTAVSPANALTAKTLRAPEPVMGGAYAQTGMLREWLLPGEAGGSRGQWH